LNVVGLPQWHKFSPDGGVTRLYLLTESHLSCHTYPESGIATFNLYCCNARPEWPWAARLTLLLGATSVSVQSISRGSLEIVPDPPSLIAASLVPEGGTGSAR
jgi:S-adenosylmethionine decarboxylase